jgi:hypothetical protein
MIGLGARTITPRVHVGPPNPFVLTRASPELDEGKDDLIDRLEQPAGEVPSGSYRPRQTGFLFSRNALTPSLKSSLP